MTRIALVFVLQLGGVPISFRRTQELLLRRIEDRTLRDGIRQRRRRPSDARGYPMGPAESRTEHELRDIVVAEFAVGGEGCAARRHWQSPKWCCAPARAGWRAREARAQRGRGPPSSAGPQRKASGILGAQPARQSEFHLVTFICIYRAARTMHLSLMATHEL